MLLEKQDDTREQLEPDEHHQEQPEDLEKLVQVDEEAPWTTLDEIQDDPAPPVEADDPEPEAPPAPPPAESADPPAPPPTPPTNPAPVPTFDNTATPPTPGATAVTADAVPLYRIEVPAYAVVPPVTHHLALSTLGTFHERRGEQALVEGTGSLPTTWGRVFRQDAEAKWDGMVEPSFDGSLFEFQAGQDLFGWEPSPENSNRIGLFVGYSRVEGDVKGQALGWNDLSVGDIDVNGTSLGGYWTYLGPNNWYLDGVLMETWFSGDTSANSGQSIDIDGTGTTASFEGGYPIALTDRWTLEPQAQIIWQHLALDDQADGFSSVSFDTDNALTGRLGFRLQGNHQTGAGSTLQPYLKINLWRNASADQTIRFDGDPIVTEIGKRSLEIGGGVIADLAENISLFATVDYTTNLGGEKTRIFKGNVGLSIQW